MWTDILRHWRELNVTAIGKAAAVLEMLAAGGRPKGLTEVMRSTGLTKPTARRLLLGLMANGLAMQHPDGRYDLGNGLVDLAARSLTATDLALTGRPLLLELQRHVLGAIVLAGFNDHELTVVAHSNASTVRYVAPAVSAAAHYATAAGKAVLACLPSADVDRLVPDDLVRFTRNTVADRAALDEELHIVRGRGFAIEDEEAEDGVRAVACAVRMYTSRPAGALSVVAPARLVAMGELVRCAGALVATADQLSASLGGLPTTSWEVAS